MIKRTRLIFVIAHLYCLSSLYGQTKYQIDSTQTLNAYTTLKKESGSAKVDTTEKRCFNVLKRFERLRLNEKHSFYWDSLRGKTYIKLMSCKGRRTQYDSLRFYYNYSDTIIKDTLSKLSALKYIVNVELRSGNYVEGLKAMDKSLKLAKSYRKYVYVNNLVQLHQFYTTVKVNTNESQTILEMLGTYKNDEDIEERTRFQIGLYEARDLSKTNKEKALQYLMSMDTTVISGDKGLYNRSIYYGLLNDIYMDLGRYKEAELSLKKAYSSEILEYSPNLRTGLNRKSFLGYYKRKDYANARIYLDKYIEKKYNDRFNDLLFLEYDYKLSKQENDIEAALIKLERYNSFRDSINAINDSITTLILNYEVTKDKEVLKAEKEKEVATLAYEKDRLVYQFIIALVIVLCILGGIAFYIYRRSKEKLVRQDLRHQKNIIEMRNEFIENLSHEFRTPFNVINGYLELIEKNTFKPEKISKFVQIGLNNTKEITNKLNNFLSLLTSGKSINTPKDTDQSEENLKTFVEEIIYSFSASATLRQVQLYFKTKLRDDGVNLKYDYVSLRKIVENLVSNAIKFTGSDKGVYVKLHLQNNNIKLIVKDEGIGMSAEEQTQVFNRFFQSTEHNISGFGIGLSLVKKLVDFHKGNITLKSEKGVGSIFSVTLPIKEALDVKLYTNENWSDFQKVNELDKSASTIETKKDLPQVLILDDNIGMCNYIGEVLYSIAHCTFAYNGEMGILQARQTQFDLIISDFQMPVMNGFDFKQELNAMPNYDNVPFLMMSGYPIDYEQTERIQLNITEYILKPFNDKEISGRVKLLLQSRIADQNLFITEKPEVVYDDSFAEIIANINREINENIKNPEFNVKELAKSCGFSESKLYKELKEKTGFTPVQVILEIRLLKAYEYLKNKTFNNVNEVMYEIGLSSPSYFSKAFSKRFGIAPSELS